MTILIDDSNYGCLLRGCLIGSYREETGEMAVSEIPVEYFQGSNFGAKVYLSMATKAVDENFAKLKVTIDERIF